MSVPVPDDRAETVDEARVDFAWSRSGLAFLAAFVILGRAVWAAGAREEDLLAVALLALAALGWAVSVLGSHVRGRASSDALERSEPRQLLALSLGTLAVAAAGVVVSIIHG
jgi:uncharacterized membrane protein YidH (DUF202 family)